MIKNKKTITDEKDTIIEELKEENDQLRALIKEAFEESEKWRNHHKNSYLKNYWETFSRRMNSFSCSLKTEPILPIQWIEIEQTIKSTLGIEVKSKIINKGLFDIRTELKAYSNKEFPCHPKSLENISYNMESMRSRIHYLEKLLSKNIIK